MTQREKNLLRMIAFVVAVTIVPCALPAGLVAQTAGAVKPDIADKAVKPEQPKAAETGVRESAKPAEEKPADTAVRVEKPAEVPRETEKPVRTVEAPRVYVDPVREYRPVEVKINPEPAQPEKVKDEGKRDQPVVIQNLPGGDGLLDFGDGVYKYKRIPGIKIADPAVAGRESKPARDEDADKDSSGTGLLGMSQRATDIMAKIVLVLIIIVVFVLYRFRSGGRRNSVLKRFPRA
ncbi:MAG: hypothetical protein EPN93_18270 [Spirochaetes bacterium]|nr:MAG: hypothetical protein EPN93_18270 [Spirochaetota bacterium]